MTAISVAKDFNKRALLNNE